VWIEGAVTAAFVPADYAVMLNWLTVTIASGHGSRSNDDIDWVTGSQPVCFADFAQRHADFWAIPAAHA
jgi:hypothetical protein